MSLTLRDLHGAGVLVWIPVVGNLVLALWAFAAGLFGRRTLSDVYWAAILAILAFVALQTVAGLLLFGSGARPRTLLHLVYGVSVVIVALGQHGLRPRGWIRERFLVPAGSRETTAMAILCLTQAGLLMRAWMTALPGR